MRLGAKQKGMWCLLCVSLAGSVEIRRAGEAAFARLTSPPAGLLHRARAVVAGFALALTVAYFRARVYFDHVPVICAHTHTHKQDSN